MSPSTRSSQLSGPDSLMTSRLTLVTAVDCHLCEHARSVAHRLAAEFKFEIRDLVVDGQGLVHQAEMRARGSFHGPTLLRLRCRVLDRASGCLRSEPSPIDAERSSPTGTNQSDQETGKYR